MVWGKAWYLDLDLAFLQGSQFSSPRKELGLCPVDLGF
jgi:hypothetical protein